MKILFLLVVAGLVWWIIRILRTQPQVATKLKAKNMVACEFCGLHIPEDECIKDNGHTYCSREHAHRNSD